MLSLLCVPIVEGKCNKKTRTIKCIAVIPKCFSCVLASGQLQFVILGTSEITSIKHIHLRNKQ